MKQNTFIIVFLQLSFLNIFAQKSIFREKINQIVHIGNNFSGLGLVIM